MNQGGEWIHEGAGMVYMKMQHYKKASDEFKKIIKSNPSYGNAYVQLGVLRRLDGKRGMAKLLFQKGLELNSNDGEANFQLGLMLLDTGKYEASCDEFWKALKKNPAHVQALSHLVVVYREQKSILRLKTSKATAWQTAESNKAMDLLNELELMDAVDSEAILHLAQIFGCFDNFEKASDLIEYAYDHDKSLQDGYVSLAWIKAEIEGKDSPDVVDFIDMDYRRNRLSANAKLVASKHFIWQRRFETAEKLVAEAYLEDFTAKAGYGRLAAAALMIGEPALSMLYWRKDKKLERESKRSAMRYQLMCLSEWQGGKGPLYIYQDIDGPDFNKVKPFLSRLYKEVSSEVTIEAPSTDLVSIARAYPGWLPTARTLFGKGEPPDCIPSNWARLSYIKLVSRYGK